MVNSSKSIIETDHLGKQFRIKVPGDERLRKFWAVKDVCFELRQGDSYGLIGDNGCGKSTLLKMISNIVTPTCGHVRVRGRIAPLLELGAGFHPDLTGRENVFLYGSLLEVKKKEIKANFDDIVDVSGLSSFIDAKVRHYSSGMIVRLAFSVATYTRPDVMLLDEIFAVGDQQFKVSCQERIKNLNANGTALLMVEHNQTIMSSICERAILMSDGKIASMGELPEITNLYNSLSKVDIP